LLAGAVLALAYATALVAKRRSRGAFEQYVASVTPVLANLLVAITFGIEAALALGLAIGTLATGVSRVAGIASGCFLVVATAFHGVRIVRGGSPSCQCFGGMSPNAETSHDAWLPALFAMRNAALIAISMWVAQAPWMWAAGSASLVAAIIVVSLLLSVRKERVAMRAAIHPRSGQFAPTLATLQAHSWWVNGHPREF
jgi:hypothetical protein